jgi:cytochrome c5
MRNIVHTRRRVETRALIASVAARLAASLAVLGTSLLFGCGEPSGDSSSTPPAANNPPSSEQPPSVSEAAMAKWSRSCVLCHVNGEGGAPRVGHPEEWVGRVEQGETVLLTHTIEGYNRMPPLGYCMDCEAEDFEALIQFMARGS